MKLKRLLKLAGIEPPSDCHDRDITGVVCDSRQARPGAFFVALSGRAQDGNAFGDDAVGRGAIAVLSARPAKFGAEIAVIRHSDPRAAFADLCAALRGFPSRALRLCGVTGTNGKTTVAFMVRDMLKLAGMNPGLIGTVQYEVGSRIIPAARTTPDAAEIQALLAQMLQSDCRSAVMEVSSHAVDQKRIRAIEFDVGVFTNLTRDHLDYHGDMENYYRAKKSFFTQLGIGGKRGTAVLNFDDPAGRRIADEIQGRAPVVAYGTTASADVRAVEAVADPSGCRMRLISPWGERQLRLKLLGAYNISNAMAAFAAGGALGIDPDIMVSALENLRAVPGRLEEIEEAAGFGFRVFVDYAHTDDALANVLKTLRPLTAGRLIAVFGCGGSRDRGKRAAMGAVAARGADLTVITSDNPRKEEPEDIVRDIAAGFADESRRITVLDRREAIGTALSIAAAGDLILIAGKGHETFQEFAHTLVPFDDRETTRALLRAMRAGSSAKDRHEP